jgi:hypothetical protein
MTPPLDQLVRRLRAVHGLDEATANAIVSEVLDAFDADLDAFIARRHRDLQRQGLSNEAIYAQVRVEVGRWRFSVPEVTERQVRRRIYGG